MRAFWMMLIWLALVSAVQAEESRNAALEAQIEALFADDHDLAAI